MAIKVFFAVLVLCTVAVVAVVMAIHFRVKRHLRRQESDVQMHPAAVKTMAKSATEQNRAQPPS